ncbi:hypothetical protein [Wenzhouxiangella sp. EGI_FJ10409]|uniref:hypothetical protein n=1 Tax=Wenzhouxiangella sp. EGI_FJ10409 TaxID=3243767 RepID=UPI0035E38719
MDWDRIRSDWQSRPAEAADRTLLPPARFSRLWRRVRRRDWVETAVAVLLALFFGATAGVLLLAAMPVPAGFAVWLTLVCIYIPLKLARVRRLIPEADPEQPVIEFLRVERRALLAQRAMLASVWRWYWGPIAVGVIGFYVSIRGWHWQSAAYVAVVVLVSLIIEYANRAAVRTHIQPALDELEQQIARMEEDDAY